jgi:hypothetical protein
MTRIHVCNGDADGLCAAVQWLMHEPGSVTLVSGLKRERALLGRVQAKAGDEVNVFDLALATNLGALRRLLQAGARVRYFDHHAFAGTLPREALFEPHLETAPDTCTSLLVDRRVGGACHGWALVGAYGDNLHLKADRLGADWGFAGAELDRLRRLGALLNYNAYGDAPTDVRFPPASVHEIMARYRDPLDMLAQETFADELDALRREDLQRAHDAAQRWDGARGTIVTLPDEAWSRRAAGTLANELANAAPGRAHAVLRARSGGGYVVSVRAPLAAPFGADALCRRFGGDGRLAAAGVDLLAARDFDRFVDAFRAMEWLPAGPQPQQLAPSAVG